jgi:hypothetical protein
MDTSGDEFGPGRDGVLVPGGQVIEHHYLVAGLQQQGRDRTADIACPTRYQQFHVWSSRF